MAFVFKGMHRVKLHISQRVKIHEKNGYLISSLKIDTTGYYCPTCDKIQPYTDWWCVLCGGPTIVGEPNSEESDTPEYDSYFETDVEKVLEYTRVTKNGNYIYKRK